MRWRTVSVAPVGAADHPAIDADILAGALTHSQRLGIERAAG